MKTNIYRIDWLIPVLGIALVGGAYCLTKSYLGLQEGIRSGQQYSATVDRLIEDCHLNRIVMQADDSGCAVTARSLDELLSANIATDNSQLASADTDTRAIVEVCFKYIARQRSQNSPVGADLPAGRSDREAAVQQILTQTLASARPDQ
jgi:hypothetical protein